MWKKEVYLKTGMPRENLQIKEYLTAKKSQGENIVKISDARRSLDSIALYSQIGPRSTVRTPGSLNNDILDFITLDKKSDKKISKSK